MAVCCAPIIDYANPFYCPEVSAGEFLSTIRTHIGVAELSFFARLSLSLQYMDDEDGSHAKTLPRFNSTASAALSQFSHSFSQDSDIDAVNGADRKTFAKRKLDDGSQSSDSTNALKRSPKRAKSDLSLGDTSFILSAKAERLRFPSSLSPDSSFGPGFRNLIGASTVYHNNATWGAWDNDEDENEDDVYYPDQLAPVHSKVESYEGFWPIVDLSLSTGVDYMRTCSEELFGRDIGPETPQSIALLVKHLAYMLPAVRLNDQLSRVGSHQKIVDYFAAKGSLNAHVLNIFRRSHIQHLHLRESMFNQAGLNVGGKEILQVFKTPNGFLLLSEITLTDIPLDDFDITLLHHLPRLERLYLGNTGVGNEAVMHLASLKYSLNHLELSANPRIDNDAIASLIVLTRLRFLYMAGTSITMTGVRKLAPALAHKTPEVVFEVPVTCGEYLRNLHLRYEPHPRPPLIVDAAACSRLSLLALKRNLLAHAARNAAVVASGTRAEMAERLRAILDTREEDLLARNVVFGEKFRGDGPMWKV